MTSDLIITASTRDDAAELAETMRAADRAEIEATSGRDPLEVLTDGLTLSAESWAARVDGEILAIWGVVDGGGSVLGPRTGIGWLLTAELVERRRRLFWRACQWELARLLDQWDLLTNRIDCRHEQALRWARRLGFRLEQPEPFGVAGLPFQLFRVTREDLHV